MHLLSFYKRMKIRAKLICGFALMIPFMGFVGYAGYHGVQQVMGNLEDIFAVRLPSIDYLLQTDRDLQQLLVAERSMIFSSAKSEIFKELLGEYETNLTQAQERWDKYKAMPKSPAEEALIPAYEKTVAEWKAISRQVIDGRVADTRQGRRLALDLSLGQAKIKFEEMRDNIDKLTEINQTLAAEAKKNAVQRFQEAVFILLLVIGGGILIAIVLAWVISSAIVRPLNAAVAGLQDIAEGEGDLTMRLQVASQDEVGQLSKWFNVFIEKLQGLIKDITGGVDTLSSSSTELAAISEQMSQGIRNVSEKSETVSAAAEEMSANMNTMAAAMEQSSTNTNMVATSSEEMSSTIDEISQNANKARSISDEASNRATEASTNMDALGAAADSIGKVVETITDISEQVNLLALNATIEAARAGEAGKGFAVVANEIKDLAKQTADATQDIKAKIDGIQSTTTTTVDQISEITQVIADVNNVVTNIATAVEQQSAATKEIAGNVAQASRGIQEVNQNVNQGSSVSAEISSDIASVNVSMNEMSSSSSQVNISAEQLSELSENLKQMVDQFKI